MKMDQKSAPSLPELAGQLLRGFFMGAADIVPGVSGGTIALILGIYRRLVDNIRNGARVLARLIHLDPSGALEHLKSIEWRFIVPLFAGIGVAFVSLSHVIETLLEDYPEEMAGVFFGLVVASILIAWKLVENWNAETFAVLATVSFGAFLLLGFQSGGVSSPAAWQWLGAGAIAICAMILPGISGSFLLLMMGMYAALLGAVNDRELGDVAIFLVGAVIGLALFFDTLELATREPLRPGPGRAHRSAVRCRYCRFSCPWRTASSGRRRQPGWCLSQSARSRAAGRWRHGGGPAWKRSRSAWAPLPSPMSSATCSRVW